MLCYIHKISSTVKYVYCLLLLYYHIIILTIYLPTVDVGRCRAISQRSMSVDVEILILNKACISINIFIEISILIRIFNYKHILR